jgi:hypothetical protein
MNNTQSIIVYRNPVEQAFWESGDFVPIFSSIIAATVVFLALHALVQKIVKPREVDQIELIFCAVVGGIVGAWVFSHLYLG